MSHLMTTDMEALCLLPCLTVFFYALAQLALTLLLGLTPFSEVFLENISGKGHGAIISGSMMSKVLWVCGSILHISLMKPLKMTFLEDGITLPAFVSDFLITLSLLSFGRCLWLMWLSFSWFLYPGIIFLTRALFVWLMMPFLMMSPSLSDLFVLSGFIPLLIARLLLDGFWMRLCSCVECIVSFLLMAGLLATVLGLILLRHVPSETEMFFLSHCMMTMASPLMPFVIILRLLVVCLLLEFLLTFMMVVFSLSAVGGTLLLAVRLLAWKVADLVSVTPFFRCVFGLTFMMSLGILVLGSMGLKFRKMSGMLIICSAGMFLNLSLSFATMFLLALLKPLIGTRFVPNVFFFPIEFFLVRLFVCSMVLCSLCAGLVDLFTTLRVFILFGLILPRLLIPVSDGYWTSLAFWMAFTFSFASIRSRCHCIPGSLFLQELAFGFPLIAIMIVSSGKMSLLLNSTFHLLLMKLSVLGLMTILMVSMEVLILWGLMLAMLFFA